MKYFITRFSIARYERDQNDKFVFTHSDVFIINYKLVNRCKSPYTEKNSKQLQLIVNGYLTPIRIKPNELFIGREKPKRRFLEAISLYYNHLDTLEKDGSKLSITLLCQAYTRGYRKVLKDQIFIPKLLVQRDLITDYKLLPKDV